MIDFQERKFVDYLIETIYDIEIDEIKDNEDIEKYKDYVLYTLSESKLRNILKLDCCKYWDDEILDCVYEAKLEWNGEYYKEELIEYLKWTLVNYMIENNDIQTEIIMDFYKSFRRKEIINKLLESIQTKN